MNTPLRVIYFGTAPFAVPPLKALLAVPARFEVVAVVSQPDKPVGRKGEVTASPVSALARMSGIPLLQPVSLKDDAVFDRLKGYGVDLFIVAAYGKIVPKRILEIPRLGPLNLHGSLLPKYRGASPIQAAILEGETVTGVTLMVMDAEVDHGPVIAKIETPIAGNDTHASLEAKLGEAGAALLAEKLEPFAKGEVEAVPQEHDKASFTKILDRADGLVNWRDEDAARIARKLRAYDPWPGAYFAWNRKKNGTDLRVKLIEAYATDKPTGAGPGTCFALADGTPAIAARSGAVALIQVQPEGKKPMPGKAFVNGHKEFLGSVLE